MTTPNHSMTPAEFLAALDRLGFAGDKRENDLGLSAFARFIGKTQRTVQEWSTKGPDSTAAVLLRLMLASKIDARRGAELLLALMPAGARGVKARKRQ